MTPGRIEADVEALAATAARFRWAMVCDARDDARRLLADMGDLADTVRRELIEARP